jgi:endonuclease-8
VPEGDSLHRAARSLQPLVGERVEVETPHPRAAVERVAERLHGRRLESVEARGKNLLLTFEGGRVLRSHLRMSGRWRVQERGRGFSGTPWLVLRSTTHEALLFGGPVLELHGRGVRELGPDILAERPDFERMLANLRRAEQTRALGEALLDQRLVSGIGNVWRAEALWHAGLSPWLALCNTKDEELRAVLAHAERLMRASLAGAAPRRDVYRRVGRPCPRCGAAIVSRGQADANRIAYWCPGCQRGDEPAAA